MALCVRDDDYEIWCRVCLFLGSIRWPWRVFVQFDTGYTAPAVTNSHHYSSFWAVRGGTVFSSERQDLNVLVKLLRDAACLLQFFFVFHAIFNVTERQTGTLGTDFLIVYDR